MEIADIPDSERTQRLDLQCGCGRIVTLMVRPQDLLAREQGEFVQVAFPYLTAAEREMFISKTCGTCWDEMFAPEGDEGPDPDELWDWPEDLDD